ncbi:MAG: alpha/beta hydrolase [Bacteroidota bacterium]|nr:alpha/beta hydrolase [Bacteroidota bacterium]
MKHLLVLFFIFFSLAELHASDSCKVIRRVYMIPGQGSDSRIFKNITIEGKEVVLLEWVMPEKNETMNSLARRMAAQIDTTVPFAIVGVSLGGMVACEMNLFLNPQKVIIISSAGERNEIPLRYRFMKYVPVYKIIPARLIKSSARFAQSMVEPDRSNEAATCNAMLESKNKLFLKRSIHCIANWNPPPMDTTNIIHIHGSNDHTLPIRFVKADYAIKDGSHMMTLTRGKEISALLNELLCE